jgi:hypothetical protein
MDGTPNLHRQRFVARLPSGQLLVPGDQQAVPGALTCAGPDAWGDCPMAMAGDRPLCEGAIWRLTDKRLWRFDFGLESMICPLSVIDPVARAARQAIRFAEA